MTTATAPPKAPDVTDIPATMRTDVEANPETSIEAKALALILLNEHFECYTWGVSRTPRMLGKIIEIIELADTEGLRIDAAAQRVLASCNDFALAMIREGLWAIEDFEERSGHIHELAAHATNKDRVEYLANYFVSVIKSSQMDEAAFDDWAEAMREDRRTTA